VPSPSLSFARVVVVVVVVVVVDAHRDRPPTTTRRAVHAFTPQEIRDSWRNRDLNPFSDRIPEEYMPLPEAVKDVIRQMEENPGGPIVKPIISYQRMSIKEARQILGLEDAEVITKEILREVWSPFSPFLSISLAQG